MFLRSGRTRSSSTPSTTSTSTTPTTTTPASTTPASSTSPSPSPPPTTPSNPSSESNKDAALTILKSLRGHEPAADARFEVIDAFLLEVKRAADITNLASKDPSTYANNPNTRASPPPATTPKTINIFPKDLHYPPTTRASTHLLRIQSARNQDPTATQFTNAKLDIEVQERGKLTEFMHDTFRRR
ncbi:hypothetical protein VE02_02533 [Pseudogymnoascus sp. 03VT05]|nr:hypothetical protein VE02_02533 [Pseudogymnoascus sp. 03VT05]